MAQPQTIVFLCPHNAAKSVIAAAYWERLATQRGLPIRATSAGTDPDPEVASRVATALLTEGLDVRAHRPRQITREELETAWRVITLGCELGELVPLGVIVEPWDDVPPPSTALQAALDTIATHIGQLADEVEHHVAHGDEPTPRTLRTEGEHP
jgi:arsenate reductase